MKLNELQTKLSEQYNNAYNQINCDTQSLNVSVAYFLEDEKVDLKVKMEYIKPAPLNIPDDMEYCGGGQNLLWKAEISMNPESEKVKSIAQTFFSALIKPPEFMDEAYRIFDTVLVNGNSITLKDI